MPPTPSFLPYYVLLFRQRQSKLIGYTFYLLLLPVFLQDFDEGYLTGNAQRNSPQGIDVFYQYVVIHPDL